MSLNQLEPFKPSLPGKSQTIFVVEGSWMLNWISFLFLTKYINLWILKKEVEVDRILAGNGNKFIGKPDLRHSSQLKFSIPTWLFTLFPSTASNWLKTSSLNPDPWMVTAPPRQPMWRGVTSVTMAEPRQWAEKEIFYLHSSLAFWPAQPNYYLFLSDSPIQPLINHQKFRFPKDLPQSPQNNKRLLIINKPPKISKKPKSQQKVAQKHIRTEYGGLPQIFSL